MKTILIALLSLTCLSCVKPRLVEKSLVVRKASISSLQGVAYTYLVDDGDQNTQFYLYSNQVFKPGDRVRLTLVEP